MSTICQWFLNCENEATTTRPGPNIKALTDPREPWTKDIPICARCDDKLNRLEGK